MLEWLEKINLRVLLTVMAVMIFLVIIFLGLNGKFNFLKDKFNNLEQSQDKKEEKNERANYVKIARKTLDWIDGQRNKDGWYISGRGCESEEKSCNMIFDSKYGNKDGLIATWARLNFYEKYKDPKDLEIVKKDIDIFYEKYKNDNLKDSLWICKITYEMAQSKNIDQVQKGKLKEICAKYNQTNIDLLDLKFNKQDSFQSSNNLESKTLINVYDSNFGVLSDMVFRYLWMKENKDINLIDSYYNSLQKIIDKDYDSLKYADDACLILNSVLDKHEINEDKKWLNQYGEWRMKINDIYNNLNKTSLVCGLLDKKLYKLSGNDFYLDSLQKVRNTIVNSIDEDYGGGFFIFSQEYQNALIKNVVENALIVEIMGDS